MKKSKVFIQYSNNDILIDCVITREGKVIQRSRIIFKREAYKQERKFAKTPAGKLVKRRSYLKHRDKILEKGRERHKKEYKENKEKILKQNKKYNQSERGKISSAKSQRKYFKTPAGKIALKKNAAKRREFGFNPLNDCFKGCEGHHINKTNVIFIPKELHRSISHSVTQNRNMHEINNLAINYYWKEKFNNMGQ